MCERVSLKPARGRGTQKACGTKSVWHKNVPNSAIDYQIYFLKINSMFPMLFGWLQPPDIKKANAP
jgi:hypothetical protein